MLGFIKKEFKQITRDPKMIMAIFFVPVMQSVLFGLALTSEVKNIQFAVVGKPTEMSRRIQTRAEASGWFKNVDAGGQNILNPADLLISRKAEAVLVMPDVGAEVALERGDKPFQLLINATNAVRAQQVDGYIKSILFKVAAEKYPAAAQGGIIQIDTRVMFNHYMRTPYFMIPALMAMSSFIVLMLVAGMALAKEKEAGTMEKLISSPATSVEIILGKTIPYFFIGLMVVSFIFILGVFAFGVPVRGYIWQIFLTACLFALAALSAAVFISTFASNQQSAMMGGFLYTLPVILLSGVFYPVENIPAYAHWLCYLNPLMYSVTNFRNIMLKGGDSALFWQYSGMLFVVAVTMAVIGYKNFKSKLN
jgi:ABC-2 type transport system permease protein